MNLLNTDPDPIFDLFLWMKCFLSNLYKPDYFLEHTVLGNKKPCEFKLRLCFMPGSKKKKKSCESISIKIRIRIRDNIKSAGLQILFKIK